MPLSAKLTNARKYHDRAALAAPEPNPWGVSTYQNGTENGDTLFGTPFPDYINGLGGNDTILGYAGEDTVEGGIGADSMDGGSGRDWLNYSTSAAAVSINLATGAADGGDADGDRFASFERLIGSAFNDTLTGDAGANSLRGGAGNDLMDGGAGIDWLDCSRSLSPTIVVLEAGVCWNADGSSDAVINFENVLGSRFVDTLVGNGNSNLLRGGAGADVINGVDGSDWSDYRGSSAGVTVNLATGATTGGDAAGDRLINIERLMGSAHADVLTGNGDQNVIRGGAGADSLDGGANFDWLDYRGSAAAVTVDLETGVASGGDADGDSITNFERVFGSDHDDRLTGDAGHNMLYGGGGNDTLQGGASWDVMKGDAGADTFVFSAATDIGLGYLSDRVVDFTRGSDLLDFSAMDLTFIGGDDFTSVAGQLRFERFFDALKLFGDSDGDGVADFSILLTLNIDITSTDLLL